MFVMLRYFSVVVFSYNSMRPFNRICTKRIQSSGMIEENIYILDDDKTYSFQIKHFFLLLKIILSKQQ